MRVVCLLVGTRRAASTYQAMCIAFDDAARRVPTRWEIRESDGLFDVVFAEFAVEGALGDV